MLRFKEASLALLLLSLVDPLWLRGSGSTRHIELTHPQVSPVRDPRVRRWFWYNLCSLAGLDCNA